jgi:hypothetical protein
LTVQRKLRACSRPTPAVHPIRVSFFVTVEVDGVPVVISVSLVLMPAKAPPPVA